MPPRPETNLFSNNLSDHWKAFNLGHNWSIGSLGWRQTEIGAPNSSLWRP